MTLLEIRQDFVKRTGRWDLVKGDKATNNGADFFILAGQRFLDRAQDLPENDGDYIINVTSGNTSLSFEDCRVVTKVWVAQDSGGNEGQFELLKKDMSWMRKNYSVTVPAINTGQPTFYALHSRRLAPSQYELEALTGYSGVGHLITGSNYGYRGIYFMPPANATYTMHIEGKWYSAALSEDDDESVWSVEHPEALILAAILMLEVFYRNREGVSALYDSLKNVYLKPISFDMADENSQDRCRLEG